MCVQVDRAACTPMKLPRFLHKIMASKRKLECSILHSKISKMENPLEFGLRWKEVGAPLDKGLRPLMVLNADELKGSAKLAGFDIDGTIIQTASGKKFPTNAKDWKWWSLTVPKKLKTLHDDGYRVCFFTNQAGIEKGKQRPDDLKMKFSTMIANLGIPVFVFISTGQNHFRKPGTKMWEYVEEFCNNQIKVDRSQSVYVGDAAGRPKDWHPGKPRDFSASDRMFADNLGVKFFTPEEFFLGEKPVKFEWRSFDPRSVKDNKLPGDLSRSVQELVVMVGMPASGKTTICKRIFEKKGYIVVNRDTLGSQAKCHQVVVDSLKSGKSVVVDNTNPSLQSRAEYIALAKKQDVEVRCIHVKTDEQLCHHMNLVRQNLTEGRVRRIPDVGYNVYKKQFVPPKISEGFTNVVEVDFFPEFESEEHKKLFYQWTHA